MEKMYLSDGDKVKILELNGSLLARQNEVMVIRDRFIDLNNNTIPRLQKELEELIKSLLKKYDCEGGTIGNDYSVNPIQGDVK